MIELAKAFRGALPVGPLFLRVEENGSKSVNDDIRCWLLIERGDGTMFGGGRGGGELSCSLFCGLLVLKCREDPCLWIHSDVGRRVLELNAEAETSLVDPFSVSDDAVGCSHLEVERKGEDPISLLRDVNPEEPVFIPVRGGHFRSTW